MMDASPHQGDLFSDLVQEKKNHEGGLQLENIF